MSRLTLLLAFGILAGCVTPAPKSPPQSYRQSQTPIYSSAVFDQTRLTGRWDQVATFARGKPRCASGGANFVQKTSGLFVELALCAAQGKRKVSGAVQKSGPGRFRIAGLNEELWVLWADGDYRTLVLGTPSGSLGFILNRGGAISGDRMVAAREILDWNGYDLAALKQLR